MRRTLAIVQSAMIIRHVAASVSDPTAGTSHSIRRLAAEAISQGHDARVETLSGWRTPKTLTPWPAQFDVPVQEHVRDASLEPFARLGGSVALRRALLQPNEMRDIVHVHGLWLMPNIYPAEARKRGLGKLVHSIRGMLGPDVQRYSRAPKLLMWHLAQREALASADCLHATSESEFTEIRRAGLKCPVAVIPNGVDIPDLAPRSPSSLRTVLSLGRLHPKKGLDRLLVAWARLETDFPEWRLRLVGPPENGYDRQLVQIAKTLNLRRFSLDGPLMGAARLDAYRSADLFVLSSINENFGLTVAEALAAELPVIATKGSPWSQLEAEGCGWWVGQSIDEITETLQAAMRLPRENLYGMGSRGRAWVARDYSWRSIGLQMVKVYDWVLGKAERPQFVELG